MSGPNFRPFLLGFVVLLLDCTSLDPLAVNACGNGVIEGNEDCDSFPNDPTDTTHARCGTSADGDSACHLQCGLQSNGNTLKCPDGWGCNVKGICREPTGTFGSALGAVSGGVGELSVGDFDGDGRRDLLGSGPRNKTNASRLRVHFFDDAGGLLQVAALPAQSVSPVVFDHDGDGRDDIAFGLVSATLSGSLGLVSGLADRTFLPVVFPAVSLPDTEAAPVFVLQQLPDVKLPNGSDNAVLLLARGAGGASLVSLDSELGGNSRLNRVLPVGPEAIRGRVLTARVFDGNPNSACGEIVVAVQTGATGSIYVMSPCTKALGGKASKWDNSAGAFQSFALPGALLDDSRGALVGDFDDDGHLDVMVDTKEGPYVAYGDPTGTSLLPPTRWSPKGVSVTMPIAVGDLNGDGKSDVVFAGFAALKVFEASDGGAEAGAPADRDGVYANARTDLAQNWTDAAIGHFNGDEFVDLVTAHVGSPDIQMFAGGVASYTNTTLTTDGIVEAIAKGDFDGDHIDDLAIAEATSVVGTSNLSIAYGRPFGGLEPPHRLGTVDKPRGLGVVPHGSGPTDLGSFSYSTKKGTTGLSTTSLTLLVGSGDRQPLAPLLFIDPLSCGRTVSPCMATRPALPPAAIRSWFPAGLAAGAFSTAGKVAVLSYAVGITVPSKPNEGPAVGAWVADANPAIPGGLAAPTEVQILDGQFDVYDESTKTTKIATATANFDNSADGLAEIVVATNAPTGTDGLLLVVHPGGPQAGAQQSKALAGLTVAPGARLVPVDLDGDGYLDVVGYFGAPPNGQVVAFLNDGKANFTVPGIRLAAIEGNPTAVAAIAIRGAPVTGAKAQTHALAVLTDHSLVLHTLRADKQGFDTKSLAPLLSGKVTGGTGIACGDFNGDGVDDIAIADGSIRLILGIPARTAPK